MSSQTSTSAEPLQRTEPTRTELRRTELTSILFEGGGQAVQPPPGEPDCFVDLNLDQLVTSIIAGRADYDLRGYFHMPLQSLDAVAYRHEVLQDLATPGIRDAVLRFGESMREVRLLLEQSEKFHYSIQQQTSFLAASTAYVTGVQHLTDELGTTDPSSRGLRAVSQFLDGYLASEAFTALATDAARVHERLDGVKYRMHLYGPRVQVSRELTEDDYAADVARTFERFQQGAVKGHLAKLNTYTEMNHVEAAIADLVAQLYPEAFTSLERFCRDHAGFEDATLTAIDREAQFYLAYLEFADRLRAAGLSMCLPTLSEKPADLHAVDAFDAALADALLANKGSVVTNDFQLSGGERLVVVTGPNQGGKSTYGRMVGQLTYLASLGLLVPGREARLLLPNRILTHFERGENLEDMTGALEDDLLRMRDILEAATPRSLVLINEIFTSTSLDDAVLLGSDVLRQIIRIGCMCVCVTFLDELATLEASIVSMVSQIVPHDPATRTFKVLRQPPTGAAYAEAIAQKYHLTAASLTERLPR